MLLTVIATAPLFQQISAEIDDAIGGIIEALEAKGILENTWIIYSSDHGEMAGDHRLSHKGVFYDMAVRVPLVVRPQLSDDTIMRKPS